jgi:hypothetical protein
VAGAAGARPEVAAVETHSRVPPGPSLPSRRAALAVGVAAALCAACRHDWSAAGPQDDGGAVDWSDGDGVVAPDGPVDEPGAEDAPGDGPGDGDAPLDEFGADEAPLDEPGAEDAPADEAEAEDADVPEAAEDDAVFDDADAPETCGNGRLDPDEQCDESPSRPCAVGMCMGEQACTFDCTWAPCDLGLAPSNDSCEGSGVTRLEDRPGETLLSGRTCAARDDVAPTCAAAGGPDVIFLLELRDRRKVEMDTRGSAFDAVLQVGSGACPGTPLACDDNTAGGTPGQALLSLTLDAGTWWVVLDGAGDTEQGPYQLRVAISDVSTGPPNDDCAHAQRLELGDSYSLTSGTTSGARDDAAGCAGSAGADVWYRIDVLSRGILYFDVVDGRAWDSVLDLRQGECGDGAWSAVACGDDACGGARSHVAALVEPGGYYLVVDGKGPADQGDFVLRGLAADGRCSAATPIVADGVYLGTTVGGPTYSRPDCAASLASAPEAFYFLALCAGRTLLATTCNEATEFDTALSLGRGTCVGSWVACNDESEGGCSIEGAEHASSLSVPISEAGLYFLVVDGALHGSAISPAGPFGLAVSGL